MKKDLNIVDFIAQIPWWICVSLSVFFFMLLKYVVPHFEVQSALVSEVHVSLGPVLAPFVALLFLSPVSFSLLRLNRKKKLLELKQEIQAIQDHSWPEFKALISEAYKHAGFIILDDSSFTSDLSVDLVMRQGTKLYLVQSRYWLNRKLGKREVRNVNSLRHDKQASGAFLLTTGIFTNEARYYAANKPVTLVDGIDLVDLVSTVRKGFSPDASS